MSEALQLLQATWPRQVTQVLELVKLLVLNLLGTQALL